MYTGWQYLEPDEAMYDSTDADYESREWFWEWGLLHRPILLLQRKGRLCPGKLKKSGAVKIDGIKYKVENYKVIREEEVD